MTLEEAFKLYNLPATGIIHVGGDGSEIERYVAMGFKRILYCEPDPVKFEKVQAAINKRPHILGVRAIAGDTNGYTRQGEQLFPMRTIDTMLIELGVHPKHFNALVLNDQHTVGLEDSKILQYLDVIMGRVLLGDESYPFDRFNGHDRVRRPSLNLWQQPHGRFANEMFQYFFATRLAGFHSLTVRTAPWAGRPLFGIDDHPLESALPVIQEHDPRPEKSALWRSMIPANEEAIPRNLCLFGNFQFHTGLYDEDARRDFREMFHPVHDLEEALLEALGKMMGDRKTLVAVHLRRGDYVENGHGMFYRTHVESVKKWLAEIWPLLDAPLLYIASDDPNAHMSFSQYGPATLANMDVKISEEFYVDFWVLSQAHALCISNSSFSFAAAMLNDAQGNNFLDQPEGANPLPRFVRPLRDGTLRAFDPWNDDVLLGRYDPVPPGSTEETCDRLLAELLPQLDPKREGQVIEVGCGTFGWTFVPLAARGFKCHAIEPMPTEGLKRACALTATSLTQCVMTDLDGEKTLYVGNDDNLNSTIAEWWGVQGGHLSKPVTSIRLSTFLKRTGIERIALLKLDVEGAEVDIIEQLAFLPREQLPHVVMFEYGGTPRKEGKGGWTSRALFKTFTSLRQLQLLGYERIAIVENNRDPVEMNLAEMEDAFHADKLFAPDAEYGNIIAVLPKALPAEIEKALTEPLPQATDLKAAVERKVRMEGTFEAAEAPKTEGKPNAELDAIRCAQGK